MQAKNCRARSLIQFLKHGNQQGFAHVEVLILLVVVVAVAAVGFNLTRQSQAAKNQPDGGKGSSTQPTQPGGTYSDWNWPQLSGGYSSFAHQLKIEDVTPNAPYFWAHQVGFDSGDGGYIGLQSQGNTVTGEIGKVVVFSIFGTAIEADGPCQIEQGGFDGGSGSGTSCRTTYDWTLGRTYSMRIAKGAVERNGTWWEGWIKDTAGGAETRIARIKVPASWQGLSAYSIMWSENFYGDRTGCDAIPYSRVRFSRPTANNSTVVPGAPQNHISQGSTICTNSLITNAGNEVIQEMGTTTSNQPTNTGKKGDSGTGTSPTPSSPKKKK